MSAALEPADGFSEQGLTEFKLTVDDLEIMVEAGVFARDDAEHVELVEGRLVRMPPESLPHARSASRLNKAIDHAIETLGLGDRLEVLNGGTVRISAFTAFGPDGAVIARDAEGVFMRASQVLLIIEASLTSLRRDLGAKSRAYAAAGVAEYWVIDIKATRLRVFRTPVDGAWSESLVFGADDLVSPLFAPGADIPLKSVF
jgi:Uma2 family endonuclease